MSDELDKRPDPLEIPTVAWLLHQLSEEGDNAGSDYNDSDAVQGYFGWSVTTTTNAITGAVRRRELEVWWEPVEDDGPKPKRHIRRFLIEEITGNRGAVTEEID